MKKQLLRLFILPAIVCAILGTGFVSTTSMAQAAALQTHPAQQSRTNLPGENCPYGDVELDNINNVWYCYSANGNYQIFLNNIYILNTGLHTVTWDWTGCDGSVHSSTKPPRTIVTAETASPNGFAGYRYMCLVPQIWLS